ncbi:MAG TPA: NADH-quinone oxidoreductase subunit M, partial [bacterium]|nr:NADH-quinone oxidoreductase subunit M [bacterium]
MILALPWIPLAGAFLILLIPRENESRIRSVALICTGLSFLITLSCLLRFQIGNPGYQFLHRIEWIPSLGIAYQVGLDGINMTLCLLHAFVSLAGVFVACRVKERLKEYLLFYLLLVGSIYGVFTSLDLFFLYLYYEMTLIPLYPMIGIWGSQNKEYGAMKLTIYITTGAVLALFGILLLYRELGINSFDLIQIREVLRMKPLGEDFQKLLTPFLLIGFGVIASLWPLHSWSPIGYAAAPTSVSMLHAGVLKKMGPYLMIRIALGLLPLGMAHWTPWLAALACIGIIYAGMAAIWQKDLKFMVGFSSVSHMGYVLLGLAAMNLTSVSGMVFLMFSHGVMAACAFALIGFIYEQAHIRGVKDFGGLAKKIPFVAACFVMTSLASLGLPGFSNFASELLIFIGSWPEYPALVALAVVGILITAIYLLRAVQSVCYGPFNPRWNHLQDAKGFFE